MNSFEIKELEEKNKERKLQLITGSVVLFIIILLASALLIGCPSYNVYTSKKQGEALLAHAQSAKEVAVATAKAKMESAVYEGQADTIRAHGVARSNAIIGESLHNNQAYLYWLWIDHIEKANVIYIPTESNLPILEAGKRNVLHPEDTK